MSRMGMDADAVESAGRALKERAGQIDAIVSGLDRSVKGLLNIWDGPDAQTFVNKWWPEHRSLLVTARGHVDGLGQSALNNASEQRGASDVKGDHGSTAPNSGGGGETPPTTTSVSGTGGHGQPLASAAQGQNDYNNRGADGNTNALFAPGGGSDGQCTSWVNFRREQLGFDVVPIAWNGEHFYPGAVTGDPTQGAVGSYANPGGPNHTFVVESVSAGPPRSISISEMNNSYLGGTGIVNTDTFTQNDAGQWVSRNLKGPRTINFGA